MPASLVLVGAELARHASARSERTCRASSAPTEASWLARASCAQGINRRDYGRSDLFGQLGQRVHHVGQLRGVVIQVADQFITQVHCVRFGMTQHAGAIALEPRDQLPGVLRRREADALQEHAFAIDELEVEAAVSLAILLEQRLRALFLL